MKLRIVLLTPILLTLFFFRCGPENPLTARDARARAEDMVKSAWVKLTKPLQSGTEGPQSVAFVSWEYRLSPPFPASWPPGKSGTLYYYAYAAGLSAAGLMDTEILGPLWARVRIDATGQSKPRLEILSREIKQIGTVGVQSLPQGELTLYDNRVIFEKEIFEAAQKSDARLVKDPDAKRFYCTWGKDTGAGAAIRRFHPEFFKWLACGEN